MHFEFLVSLSQSILLCLLGNYVCGCFSIFISLFGVGLLAYFSSHSQFSRKHIFVGFNKFPSIMCWSMVIIITGHRGLLFLEE